MIILIIVLIIGILFIFYRIYQDKMTFLLTKLNIIEEKINSTLIKRKELIKDSEKIIKNVTKTNKDVYQEFDSLNEDSKDIIKLDRKLLVYINEFYLIKDKYKELNKNEEFQNISFSINETEDLLNAYKDYYNKNATLYNKLIKQFPIIIFSKIKGKKEKLFFDKKNLVDDNYAELK